MAKSQPITRNPNPKRVKRPGTVGFKGETTFSDEALLSKGLNGAIIALSFLPIGRIFGRLGKLFPGLSLSRVKGVLVKGKSAIKQDIKNIKTGGLRPPGAFTKGIKPGRNAKGQIISSPETVPSKASQLLNKGKKRLKQELSLPRGRVKGRVGPSIKTRAKKLGTGLKVGAAGVAAGGAAALLANKIGNSFSKQEPPLLNKAPEPSIASEAINQAKKVAPSKKVASKKRVLDPSIFIRDKELDSFIPKVKFKRKAPPTELPSIQVGGGVNKTPNPRPVPQPSSNKRAIRGGQFDESGRSVITELQKTVDSNRRRKLLQGLARDKGNEEAQQMRSRALESFKRRRKKRRAS